MSLSAAHVLIVEDVAALAEVYRSYLAEEACSVESVDTITAAREAVARRVPEVVLLDVMLPDGSGMDILRELREADLPVDVIVMTSEASVGLAVEAMRMGAVDFLTKPFSARRLQVTIRNALTRRRLESAVATIRDEIGRDQFCGFIGQSMAMQSVYRIMQNAAASDAPIFVAGERGTGKSLCARALHRLGRRHDRPFLAVDCTALPADRIEVELFGQWARAATQDREGVLLKANGGTVFLDEIGALPAATQAKLLRYLHTGSIRRLNEHHMRTTDVRLICATDRDLRADVSAGRFNEELFYKIDVLSIGLPPLRERDDDVLLIARWLLPQLAAQEGRPVKTLSPEVEAVLLTYAWPGNVRELENVLRGAIILSEGDRIEVSMLPAPLAGIAAPVRLVSSAASSPQEGSSGGIEPLDRVVRRTIEGAIAGCQGNIPRAAAALQVTPASIYRRLQAWQAEGENASPVK